jgi:hypothetical protein
MNNKCALVTAVAAALGGASTAAHAATFNVALTAVANFSNSGSLAGNITSSTATFSYDDVTNGLTQTGGTFNVRFTVSPVATLFRHLITGAVIGNGSAATASTYACAEGNFGGNVGAHICGNYGFGVDFVDDSTVTWGPGTAFARTFGGDDFALGAQQNLAAYDGFSTSSWNGNTLVLSNANTNLTSGYRWTLSAVPIPAAGWLFGSALGVMGWMRTKFTN